MRKVRDCDNPRIVLQTLELCFAQQCTDRLCNTWMVLVKWRAGHLASGLSRIVTSLDGEVSTGVHAVALPGAGRTSTPQLTSDVHYNGVKSLSFLLHLFEKLFCKHVYSA